jgi:hypothetical protein
MGDEGADGERHEKESTRVEGTKKVKVEGAASETTDTKDGTNGGISS